MRVKNALIYQKIVRIYHLKMFADWDLPLCILFFWVCTLVARLYRTRSFLQNILGCYTGKTQDSETNDASFESIYIMPLELVMEEGVAVS